MHDVAILVATAAAGHVVARWLRLPAIPFLLLAGLGLSFVASPSGGTVENALVVGVTFVLFVAGLELDPERMRAQRRAAVWVGTFQFLVLTGAGAGTARLLGFGVTESLYLGLGLAASSTLVGVRLLQGRRQMFEPFGRLVLGVLLLQDLLVLLAIPLLIEAVAGGSGVLAELGGIAALGLLCAVTRAWIADLLLWAAGDEEERLLLGALAVLFGFLALADLLDVPMILGAFLAGFSLSRFPVNGMVRTELAPIGDFFAALFFTALGALVSVPDPTELRAALVLAAVVLVVTPPLVTVVAERTGFTAKPAIEAGLLLSQTSEISLVIVLSGMMAGQIGGEVLTIVALATGVTMLLTPFMATDAVAWRLMHFHPSRRRDVRERGSPPSGHVLLLGAGSTGMPLVERLLLAGCDLLVVDDDPRAIGRLAEAEVRTLRGDAADRAVLRRAGADRARVVISTIRRPRDNDALLRMARDVTVLVRVFDEEEAKWVRERGGIAVVYSEATAQNLMEWFERQRPRLEASLRDRLGAEAA